MKKPRITTEDFVKRAKKVHGDRYDYSKAKYTGALKKLTVICKKHGEFLQTASEHIHGSGCTSCKNEKNIKPVKIFLLDAIRTHGNKYDYSFVNYHRSNEKIKIGCKLHGEFLQTPSEHIQGYGCPRCGGSFPLTTEEFIKMAKEIHGDKYDYSKTTYVRAKDKIAIICKEHGEFLQSANAHLSAKKGCHKCGGNYRLTTDEFINKSKNVHGNRYDYSQSNYINSFKKVKIICPTHGKFQQAPNAHLSGKGCKKCTAIISNKETRFLDILKIPHVHRQKYIKPYYVDGISKNIIYEFLGDFWHGNPALYKEEDMNKATKITFGQLYDKTRTRFDALVNLGYVIKYVWENEWDEWQKNKTAPFPLKEYNSVISGHDI